MLIRVYFFFFTFICSEAFSTVVALQCVEWSDESASSTVLEVKEYLNADTYLSCLLGHEIKVDVFVKEPIFNKEFNLCHLSLYTFYGSNRSEALVGLRDHVRSNYYVRSTDGVCPYRPQSPHAENLENFILANDFQIHEINDVLLAVETLFGSEDSTRQHFRFGWFRGEYYREFRSAVQAGVAYKIHSASADRNFYEVVINTSERNWVVEIEGDLRGKWKVDKVGVVQY